jgi:hypothetical protein
MIDELQDDDDAALDARARARLGETLRDKYRLDRVLGSGGMATVYAATHRNGKEVALKLLHPEIAHHAEIRNRFLREGYVANQVKHPGAVSVTDDDVTEEGWAFLVMELLDGLTVQDLWESRGLRMHPAWVTAIVLQLLDVMAAAHANGVIHRDLKPANLFVTRDGELKVLDFGIARMRDVGIHTTNAGSVLGTPAFMAPEQAMAQSKEIDPKTDLWAIGSVAFALLVGEVVHPAENTQQTLIHAATRPARPLGPLAPDAPPEIVRVFERALTFEKAGRWASATEMRDALVLAAEQAFGAVPGETVLREALQGSTAVVVRPAAEATLDVPVVLVIPPSGTRTLTANDRATLRGLAAPPRLPSRGHGRGVAGAGLFAFSAAAAAFFLLHVASPPGGLASATTSLASPSIIVGDASDLLGSEQPRPADDIESTEAATAPSVTTVTRDSTVSGSAQSSSARPHSLPVSSTAKPAVAPVSSSARAHCTPPFTIDPTSHRKIWKMECL